MNAPTNSTASTSMLDTQALLHPAGGTPNCLNKVFDLSIFALARLAMGYTARELGHRLFNFRKVHHLRPPSMAFYQGSRRVRHGYGPQPVFSSLGELTHDTGTGFPRKVSAMRSSTPTRHCDEC